MMALIHMQIEFVRYGNKDIPTLTYDIVNFIRPVFILNHGIKITAGDGKDTPYTLAP